MTLLQMRSTLLAPSCQAQQQCCLRDLEKAYCHSLLDHQFYLTMIKITMLLLSRQPHINADIVIHKRFPILPTGSTVMVHHENWGPCTHGTMVGHRPDDLHSRSFKIQVTKMVCIISRTKRHIKTMLITANSYLGIRCGRRVH